MQLVLVAMTVVVTRSLMRHWSRQPHLHTQLLVAVRPLVLSVPRPHTAILARQPWLPIAAAVPAATPRLHHKWRTPALVGNDRSRQLVVFVRAMPVARAAVRDVVPAATQMRSATSVTTVIQPAPRRQVRQC